MRILESLETNLCFENGEVILANNEGVFNIQIFSKENIRKRAMSNVAALVLNINFSDHILTEEVIKEANNRKLPIISLALMLMYLLLILSSLFMINLYLIVIVKLKVIIKFIMRLPKLPINLGMTVLLKCFISGTWT